MTPTEPADPMDCNRYPDSPFCGGNPFSLRPLGIEIALVKDECNLGVQFQGVIGFIKLPPHQLVYRDTSGRCAPRKYRNDPPTAGRYLPPIPDEKYCNGHPPLYVYYRNYTETYQDDGLSKWGYYEKIIHLEHIEYPYFLPQYPGEIGAKLTFSETVRSGTNNKGVITDATGSTFETDGKSIYTYTSGMVDYVFHPRSNPTNNVVYRYTSERRSYLKNMYVAGYRTIFVGIGAPARLPPYDPNTTEYTETYFDGDYITNTRDASIGEYWLDPPFNDWERWEKSPEGFQPIKFYNQFRGSYESTYLGRYIDNYFGAFDSSTVRQYLYDAIRLESIKYDWTTFSSCGEFPLNPPPPSPPEKCKCMCCPGQNNNDQLLRLILKRIGTPKTVEIFDEDLDRKGTQKAKKTPQDLNTFLQLTLQRIEIANRIIGIASFPVTVPDTVIEPYKQGIFGEIFKFINGNKKRKINSLTELTAWLAEQDSAVLGQFHQVIQFTDEDGEKQSIVLPNVAETLKEITLIVAQMAKQNNAQTNAIFRALSEISATKVQAVRAATIAEDIQDYLDYPTQKKVVEVDVMANFPDAISDKPVDDDVYGIDLFPDAEFAAQVEDYQKFLSNGKASMIYEDWTGENSLHDQLLDALQVLAMMRAVLYARTDKD
ncbi:MAG: hypothetical protein C6Y22_22205 [Hapalosiphonaceae cyanobacterium JJU2]|nr:MAG: hypothetical protein C6Y22_22205 [Hapalosiphonaceae cyanobacterium JJU2]